MSRLVLVVPPNLAAPTGGNRYDLELAAALRRLGVLVEQRPAAGVWPVAEATDRDRLAALLTAPVRPNPAKRLDEPDSPDVETRPAGPTRPPRSASPDVPVPVLVDGLVACGAPEAVARGVAAGARVYVLVHLPLALETGLAPAAAAELEALEGRALRAATGVIATSHWAAEDLRARHRLDAVAVAAPGTDPAPAATGSTPPRLLQLASVTPRKEQVGVVEALALIQDLPWTADLTGSVEADPDYAERVQNTIEQHGLSDRVRLTGPLTGADLEAAWDATDLLLLPSIAETFGMVVTEALAREIPVVVGRGTGAEEALGLAPDGSLPGATVPTGNPVLLATALRDLLGPERERTVESARQRSRTLSRWQNTAEAILAAVR